MCASTILSSPIFPLLKSTEKLRMEGVLLLIGLTLEGLDIPLDGDENEDVQSLPGDAGLVAPLIGDAAIILGEAKGPSLLNLFD
jgi:hypothetical protein